MYINTDIAVYVDIRIWASTWQDQQNECAPSEDSDQPGHPPSLIRAFAVRTMGSKGPKLSSCGQRRLWSDRANSQADLSLRWAHTHFVGFVMSRLICVGLLLNSGSSFSAQSSFRLYYELIRKFTFYRNLRVKYWARHQFLHIVYLIDYIWATTRQNVSSRVSDHARHKPACAATEAG